MLMDTYGTIRQAAKAIDVSRRSLSTKLEQAGVRDILPLHYKKNSSGENVRRDGKHHTAYLSLNPHYAEHLREPIDTPSGCLDLWEEVTLNAMRDAKQGDKVAERFLESSLVDMLLEINDINREVFEKHITLKKRRKRYARRLDTGATRETDSTDSEDAFFRAISLDDAEEDTEFNDDDLTRIDGYQERD